MTPKQGSEQPKKHRAAHLEKHKWKKGQPSPNPGGRPKSKHVTDRLRKALEDGDADLIADVLIALAKSGDTKAADMIMDRTEGKPAQTHEISGKDGGPIVFTLRRVGDSPKEG